jgi:hypothetical protein
MLRNSKMFELLARTIPVDYPEAEYLEYLRKGGIQNTRKPPSREFESEDKIEVYDEYPGGHPYSMSDRISGYELSRPGRFIDGVSTQYDLTVIKGNEIAQARYRRHITEMIGRARLEGVKSANSQQSSNKFLGSSLGSSASSTQAQVGAPIGYTPEQIKPAEVDLTTSGPPVNNLFPQTAVPWDPNHTSNQIWSPPPMIAPVATSPTAASVYTSTPVTNPNSFLSAPVYSPPLQTPPPPLIPTSQA